MILKSTLQRPSTLVRLGALFFLLSSVLRWFVHPAHDPSADLRDGFMGLFYGLSIGLFLLAVWRKSHRRV